MNKIRLSALVLIASFILGCTPHNEKTEIKVQFSEIDYIYSLSNYTSDSVFLGVFRATQKSYNAAEEDFVTALGSNLLAKHPDYMLTSVFSTFDLRDKLNYQSTNNDVINVLKEEVKRANETTLQILKRRIEFALTTNLFNKLEVLVMELPEKNTFSLTINRKVDKNTISDLLQKRGDLGFWETHELSSIWEYLNTANQEVKDIIASSEKVNSEKDSITMANPLFSVLMPAISQDGSIQKGCLIGYSRISDTSIVNQYLNSTSVRSIFPRDFIPMWSTRPFNSNDVIQLFAIKSTRDGKAILTGDCVVSAKAKLSKQPLSIHLAMNAEGANIWGRMTNYNIDRQIAIVIDNAVYAAPFVYSEIKTGESELTGDFTPEEATNLAAILSAGRLPGITVNVISVNN